MRATQKNRSDFGALARPLRQRPGRAVSSFSEGCRSPSQSRTGGRRATWLGSQGTSQEYHR